MKKTIKRIREIISKYESNHKTADYIVVWREYIPEGRGHWDIQKQDPFFKQDPQNKFI